MRIAFMGGLAVLLGAASSMHALPLKPPSAAQLRELTRPDIIRYRYCGIDYARALERALRKEPSGLAELFRATYTCRFDAGAGEAHTAILLGLLQRWGDRRYAQVLRAQPSRVRRAVMGEIASALDEPERRHFPETYSLAPH